jgi:hypothetical protein
MASWVSRNQLQICAGGVDGLMSMMRLQILENLELHNQHQSGHNLGTDLQLNSPATCIDIC